MPIERVFDTKDDGKIQRLTDRQAADSFNKLGKQAGDEWATGLELSREKGQRAEAENVYSWGLQLLFRAQNGQLGTVVPGIAVLSKNSDKPMRLIGAAIADDPNNAQKWQALGDFLYLGRGGEFGAWIDSSAKVAPLIRILEPFSRLDIQRRRMYTNSSETR